MACRLEAVTLDARDPRRLARFWASLLDRAVVQDGDAVAVPGDEVQLGLRFAPNGADRVGANRMHLHLTSDHVDQQDTVATAVRLGAAHVDIGQRPEEGHVVLADPEGNAFCVIEPGNRFLAGTGFLGELACDGTREVGLFWRDVLEWPLVWDQDGETAVQSPRGGTKVAWGGPPVAAHDQPDRQRFHLVTSRRALPAEVDRLLGLGARRLDGPEGPSVVLADPDGTEFLLRAD